MNAPLTPEQIADGERRLAAWDAVRPLPGVVIDDSPTFDAWAEWDEWCLDHERALLASARALLEAQAELARVTAERDALRADAERLEWLDAHPREGSIRIGAGMKRAVVWGISAAPGITMREAIDGARTES